MFNDPVPKVLGTDRFIYFTFVGEVEIRIILHRVHECVRKEDGNVGIFYHIYIAGFDLDEFFNIGMIYAKRLHIGAAPSVLGDGIGIFAVKIHEAGRAAGLSAGTVNIIAGGAEDRKVVPAAAAEFVGQRFFSNGAVDGFQIIILDGNNVAVVERGGNVFPAGAVHNSAAGRKTEILEDGHKFGFPLGLEALGFFDAGECLCLARPELVRVFFPGCEVFVFQYIGPERVSFIICFDGVRFGNVGFAVFRALDFADFFFYK